MPVQLRLESGLSSTDYVTGEGWRLARLARCPLHPRGGCGFARHGSYARVSPAGTRIARWYCPTGHCTFSLLPDHLAARFPGTLSEIEHVVATVEQAKSLEAAADRLRSDDITLPSAVRWVRRRVAAVRSLLTIVVGLFPQWVAGLHAGNHRGTFALGVRRSIDVTARARPDSPASPGPSARILTPAGSRRWTQTWLPTGHGARPAPRLQLTWCLPCLLGDTDRDP